MILLFFLTNLGFSNCTYYLKPQVGFMTFYQKIRTSEEVCINITHYPFFIIFGEMPQNMKYLEYRSTNSTKNLTLYKSVKGELLPYFYRIEFPFASITMFCPSGGNVSFSIGTIPGICKTGIFFTNFRNLQIELSSEYQLEKSIYSFDDKCVLFTTRGIQNFYFDYDLLGNLLIYKNAFDFKLLDGKGSFNFSIDASYNPTLLRILIGNTTRPQKVSLSIKNNYSAPLNEFNIFYDPINRTNSTCPEKDPCNFFLKVDWELVAIICAFITASIVVFGAFFYVLSLLYCPSFIQHTPLKTNELRTEPSLSIAQEAMASNPEPKGYFAMDPILRPPVD